MDYGFKCSICGKPATVHYKETFNGKTREVHYCSECAKISMNNSNSDIITTLFNIGKGNNYKSKIRVCKCGTTENDIYRTGKFGCSECYNVFRDIAEQYVTSMGYNYHKGKAPIKLAGSMSEIDKLKLQLEKAVAEERYLDADKIAKQIEELGKNK